MATATVSTADSTGTEASDTDPGLAIDQRCRVYRDEFGFNTFRDPRTGAITMVAGRVSAVITTNTVGPHVRTLLGAGSVPVFSVGHRVWVFLTDPPTPTDDIAQLNVELFTHSAVPLFSGALIALPTPGNAKRCWLHLPDGHSRPSFAAVVDAVETAAAQADSQ
ncbi:hypothetical protein [Nocardia australiensis]|uniref:hypothetical protein n=1 Tax=Nocardia australiensis TaxID=2887191 RepID=UPI001D154B97|nr:hypothetical protein [Nocardia australiensis]